MICEVRCGDGMTDRARSSDGSLVCNFSRCSVGSDRCLHGCTCINFSVRPCSSDLQRTLRAIVVTRPCEKMQHTISAICSPTSEKDMAGFIQRSTPVSSHKASISHGELVLSLMGLDSVPWPNELRSKRPQECGRIDRALNFSASGDRGTRGSNPIRRAGLGQFIRGPCACHPDFRSHRDSGRRDGIGGERRRRVASHRDGRKKAVKQDTTRRTRSRTGLVRPRMLKSGC